MANQTLLNFDGQDVDLSQMPEGHHMQIDYCDPDAGEYAVFHLTFGESAARNRSALFQYLLRTQARERVKTCEDQAFIHFTMNGGLFGGAKLRKSDLRISCSPFQEFTAQAVLDMHLCLLAALEAKGRREAYRG